MAGVKSGSGKAGETFTCHREVMTLRKHHPLYNVLTLIIIQLRNTARLSNLNAKNPSKKEKSENGKCYPDESLSLLRLALEID